MNDREKLIELLESVPHPQRLYPDLFVDMLIENGVTIKKDYSVIAKQICDECGIGWNENATEATLNGKPVDEHDIRRVFGKI